MSGSGTLGDPLIIEGWDINGTGVGFALYIGNTTAHFVVKGNRVHHAGPPANFWSNGGCISLRNVRNGSVQGNNLSAEAGHSYYGVHFRDSPGNRADWNNVTGTSWAGLVADTSASFQGSLNHVWQVSGHGIFVLSSPWTNVIDNRLHLNSNSGVKLGSGSDFGRIERNEISGDGQNGSGIVVELADYALVSENVVRSHAAGVYLYGNADVRVESNNLTGNVQRGVHVESSTRTLVLNNSITSTAWWGVYLTSGGFNEVRGNVIALSGRDGVLFWNSGDNLVVGNTIRLSTSFGANISPASSPISRGNLVSGNDFVDNNAGAVQAADHSGGNRWNDSLRGNYWSDFDFSSEGCWDNNTNGICDAPYLIPGGVNARDFYPLTTQTVPEFKVSPTIFALALLVLSIVAVAGTRCIVPRIGRWNRS